MVSKLQRCGCDLLPEHQCADDHGAMPQAKATSPRGLSLGDVVGALGGGLLRVAVEAPGPEVDDITLAEPRRWGLRPDGRPPPRRGHRVSGSSDRADRGGAAGSGAAVSSSGAAWPVAETSAGPRIGSALPLVELADHASWAHVVWLLRGILDRAATGAAARSDGPVHDDLFALADACAALVEAPVTIEDTQSRVLAYSSRQDVADPVRLSTIVGRKVPDAILDESARTRRLPAPCPLQRSLLRPIRPRTAGPARHSCPGRGRVVGLDLGGRRRAASGRDDPVADPDGVCRGAPPAAAAFADRPGPSGRCRPVARPALGQCGRGRGVAATAAVACRRAAAATPTSTRRASWTRGSPLVAGCCWRRPLLALLDDEVMVLLRDTGSDQSQESRAAPGTWDWLRVRRRRARPDSA